MRDHLRSTAFKLRELTKIKKKELVLDIASNDGTLLNFYSKNLIPLAGTLVFLFKIVALAV